LRIQPSIAGDELGATSPREGLKRTAANLHFWLVVAMLAVGAMLHYTAQIRSVPEVPVALSRHAMERVLFVLPIAYAAFNFGMVGGLATVAAAVLLMLPRVLFISPHPVDAFVETVAVALVGGLMSWMVETQEREKDLRQNAFAKLRTSEARLRYYLRHILRAQEDERKRIARELHDDTAQALVVLTRRLDALDTYSGQLPDPVMQRLGELRELADDILVGVRRFSRDLRPPVLDDLGLLPALELLTADSEQNGIKTELKVLGERRSLSPDLELVLFRIVQEALRNVKKHAHASKVLVQVEFGDATVKIAIKDDGKGFRLPEDMDSLAEVGKLGVIGMQERAQLVGGALNVQSLLGKGTTVAVDVPV
jgi:two-component system sensor histidine kinase DegS